MREDFEAPAFTQPTQLTQTEADIVFREINAGASEEKLARYFDTTVSIIKQAYKYMEHRYERSE